MSDLTHIQQQINKQDSGDDAVKNRPDALQEEMLVDTMMEEANQLDTDIASRTGRQADRKNVDSVGPVSNEGVVAGASTHMLLSDSLFGSDESDNGNGSFASATQQLSQLVGADLVRRAFQTGSDLLVNEIRQSLLQQIEKGLNPSQFQLYQQCSMALDGIVRSANANPDFDIRNDEVASIKGVLDSGVVAYGAVHAQVWDQDNETILAFQNLTQAEAEEVESEILDTNSDTISDSDRHRIKAMGVTAIEVEEVLVDFWEAAQNEKYQITEDEDLS